MPYVGSVCPKKQQNTASLFSSRGTNPQHHGSKVLIKLHVPYFPPPGTSPPPQDWLWIDDAYELKLLITTGVRLVADADNALLQVTGQEGVGLRL